MRSIFILLAFTFMFTVGLFAQSPALFKYQAVARDADGALYQNQLINLRMTIIQHVNNNDWTVYGEEHTSQTSANGMFSLNIGAGQVMIGDIAQIDWSEGQYYLNVEMALPGEELYTDLGRSPILPVPIALHAKTAEMVDDADADPGNELQNLTMVNNRLLISGGNYVDMSNYLTRWSPTESGIAYRDGKVETNLIKTIGLEASLGSNTATLNADFLEFQLNDVLSSTLLNRNGLEIANGIKVSTLGANKLKFKSLNNAELNENEIRFNGVNTGTSTLLNSTLLTMTESRNSFRKFDAGLNGLMYEEPNKKFVLNIDGASYFNKQSSESVLLKPDFIQFSQNGNSLSGIFTKGGAVFRNSAVSGSLSAASLIFASYSSPNRNAYLDRGGIKISDNNSKSSLIGETLRLENKTNNAIVQFNSDGLSMFNKARQRLKFTTTSEGRIEVFDPNGKRGIHLETKNGSGHIQLEASTGKKTVEITSNNSRSGNGYIGLFNYEGKLRASTFPSTYTDAGNFYTYGQNNSKNILLTSSWSSPSRGQIDVYDDKNIVQVSLGIDNYRRGYIAADLKNFHMDHPAKPGKEIWYASLEGPEAGAYARGTGKLSNGEVFIPYTDHFKHVGNPETVTVILTPLSADTRGLAVIEKTEKGFRVKELMGGKGNFQFDWEVKAVRKGFENYEVIRDKVASKEREGGKK